MLKSALRDLNRFFPHAGLPKPTSFLNKFGLTPRVEFAMENLGIREYFTVTYPANGGSLRVAVRRTEPWLLMENRLFEFDCLEYVSRKVDKGATIIDIGAGTGVYTLLFSLLVGENGQVKAFEPDPKSRAMLCDNVRRNRARNVKVDGRCVSNSSGTAVLRSSGWGTGLSTIMTKMCPNPIFEKVVPTTSIDELCREQGLMPDGIKIDVEGAEKLVLEGARATLSDNHVWLLVEFHSGCIATKEMEDTWRLLTDRAKSVVLFKGTGILQPSSTELVSFTDFNFSHVFIEF